MKTFEYIYYKEIVGYSVIRGNNAFINDRAVIWRYEINDKSWEYRSDKRFGIENDNSWQLCSILNMATVQRVKEEYNMESFREISASDVMLEMI